MLLGVAGTGPGSVSPLLPDESAVAVEVDWLKDGFDDYIDDVTASVRPGVAAISCEYGRDQTTALAPTVAGRGGFALGNRDRRFTPRNTTGPLYGKLKPGRPVRITRTIGPAVYGLFYGHTDDQPLNPDLDAQTVTLSLLDYLADLRGQTVSTSLHRDIRTGAAINLVLDACGWPAALRDIDNGSTIIPWWWEDGTDALEAIEKIVKSEGPPALITQGGNGEIIFRDRHHRLTDVLSLLSNDTWRDVGRVEPVMHRGGFVYDEAWSHIVNTGSVSVDVRKPGELDVIWSAGEDVTVTLSAGEQRILTASADSPFTTALTPEVGADYRLVSGSVSVRLIKPSGASTGIEFTASAAGPVVLTALQLRGYPLTTAYTIQVSASDPASVAEYGPRAFPNELPWCSVNDAQAILDHTVAMRSQPLPQIQTRFMVGGVVNTPRALKILPRDLSDRVTIIEPETGLAGDFFIESIRHELTGVHDHTVTFGLEAAYTDTEPVARCDVAGAGADQGILSRGVDDADMIARCDSAFHVLNSAVAAH